MCKTANTIQIFDILCMYLNNNILMLSFILSNSHGTLVFILPVYQRSMDIMLGCSYEITICSYDLISLAAFLKCIF